ncbi:MAG TPA: hypothetical protein VEB43_04645 [Anaeromyxobacter sp.]|nr:hypothetical protein [Anaeromyxobacter sp.]
MAARTASNWSTGTMVSSGRWVTTHSSRGRARAIRFPVTGSFTNSSLFQVTVPVYRVFLSIAWMDETAHALVRPSRRP